MCWEQSHRQRTIAASRSDDNRDESQEKRDNSKLPTNLPRPTKRNRPVGHTLPLRTNPGENRFGLTSSFRNGHLDRRAPSPARCFGVSSLKEVNLSRGFSRFFRC